MQVCRTRCIGALLMIASLACRNQPLSTDQQLLRALYPAALAESAGVSNLPFRYVTTNFTAQPSRWMVAAWGALPRSVPDQIAELALLDESAETIGLVARLPIRVSDWPGEGELVAVELSSVTYAVGPKVDAIAVRAVRKLPELQPALYVESLALYQPRETTLSRMLYRTAGFYEGEPSDPKAIRAVLLVDERQMTPFSNLLLVDNKGGSTTLRWNGVEYVQPISLGQAQKIRLESVRQVLGSGPDLEAYGNGSAIVDGGTRYMWGSSTPPEIRVALAAPDAVIPSLCSRLVGTGIPPGKALELKGTGTFDNTGKPPQLSARFRLSTLSSCEWVDIK